MKNDILAGSARDLTELLSWRIPKETEEEPVSIARATAKILD
jgi:hypothetical protein